MKKALIVLSLLILSQVVLSQIFWYSAQSEVEINENISMSSITLDLCKNELGLSFFLFGSYHELKTSVIVMDDIYKINIFNLQEIQFKKIDKYRIIILNTSLFFKRNDLLYCHNINDCNNKRIEGSMFWNKGMRDGNWQHYTDKGIITTAWRHGRKTKEFFKTYEEVNKISSKLRKM